ncbi:DUF397 domain-containing protein [Actinomadura sp. 3N508]|uniref:DUF397 domain-containing protein n=1 Tax=Actinomadura sp. 3N508 TaxID=3375153 RepID=UPI0037AF354F
MRTDLANAKWRKSSYSGGTGDCVEVADLAESIAVRDSKAPAAGHLMLSVESFARLVARVKRDELDF